MPTAKTGNREQALRELIAKWPHEDSVGFWEPGANSVGHKKEECHRCQIEAALATQGAQAGEFDARAWEALENDLKAITDLDASFDRAPLSDAHTLALRAQEKVQELKRAYAAGQAAQPQPILYLTEDGWLACRFAWCGLRMDKPCEHWRAVIDRFIAAQPLQREAALSQKVAAELAKVAKVLNGGEYEQFVTHVVTPICCRIVVEAVNAAAPLQPQVEELQELSKAASQGEWFAITHRYGDWSIQDKPVGAGRAIAQQYGNSSLADAAFIVACVNAVRKWLAPTEEGK